jgi:hypothetical protein
MHGVLSHGRDMQKELLDEIGHIDEQVAASYGSETLVLSLASDPGGDPAGHFSLSRDRFKRACVLENGGTAIFMRGYVVTIAPA